MFHRKTPITPLIIALALLSGCVAHAGATIGISEISATRDEIIVTGRTDATLVQIAELEPYQGTNALFDAPMAVERRGRDGYRIKIPRWDGSRDRLYSGFLAFDSSTGMRRPIGEIRYVEEFRGVARYTEQFPRAASKKGLQVQMVDDAIALGVKHAGLNVSVPALQDLSGQAGGPAWSLDGVAYHFRREAVEALDHQVKALSDAGMTVTLILLCYRTGDAAVDRVMLHPKLSPETPHALSAFNTATRDGLRYFKASMEFLAERYSRPDRQCGRAVNFIVGNEVNSHWEWNNMGEATLEEFTEDYLRTVRVCNTAIHKVSEHSRVYVSLEHHWNMQSDGPLRSFAGRTFIDRFNLRAIAGGNFDWCLAFHPYPEDLTDPRTWNDKTATLSEDTPRITFKNLEMLPHYFRHRELLYHGKPRPIILSEQGFNSPNTPEGELWQAAGYCYAWYRISRMQGIDSFILNRHVDHRDEFGLNLGLWRRDKASKQPSKPEGKKMIYEVFRLADTPQWRQAFAFALPVIGIRSWDEIRPKTEDELRQIMSATTKPPGTPERIPPGP